MSVNRFHQLVSNIRRSKKFSLDCVKTYSGFKVVAGLKEEKAYCLGRVDIKNFEALLPPKMSFMALYYPDKGLILEPFDIT